VAHSGLVLSLFRPSSVSALTSPCLCTQMVVASIRGAAAASLFPCMACRRAKLSQQNHRFHAPDPGLTPRPEIGGYKCAKDRYNTVLLRQVRRITIAPPVRRGASASRLALEQRVTTDGGDMAHSTKYCIPLRNTAYRNERGEGRPSPL
jgi:hypothetical protein